MPGSESSDWLTYRYQQLSWINIKLGSQYIRSLKIKAQKYSELLLPGWIIYVKLATKRPKVTSAPIAAQSRKSMMKCILVETTDVSQSVQNVRRPKKTAHAQLQQLRCKVKNTLIGRVLL